MISKLSAKYQFCAIRTADTRDGQLTTPGVYTWVVRELSIVCPSFVHRLYPPWGKGHAAGRWFDSRTRHVSLLGVKTWLSTLEIVYLCLSEETLKAVGPFYRVPMLGEVK